MYQIILIFMVNCMILRIRIFAKYLQKLKLSSDKIWKKFIVSLSTLETNHIEVNGEFLNI